MTPSEPFPDGNVERHGDEDDAPVGCDSPRQGGVGRADKKVRFPRGVDYGVPMVDFVEYEAEEGQEWHRRVVDCFRVRIRNPWETAVAPTPRSAKTRSSTLAAGSPLTCVRAGPLDLRRGGMAGGLSRIQAMDPLDAGATILPRRGLGESGDADDSRSTTIGDADGADCRSGHGRADPQRCRKHQ